MMNLTALFSSLLHLDKTLISTISNYGMLTYILLFLVVFCETGLVIFPFLPGDSLLFAVGALCGSQLLNPVLSICLLASAAILGNMVNYSLGRLALAKTSHSRLSKFINPLHLEKTKEFFKKYGPAAIILARFIPIFRTVAPFVAGMSQMPRRLFFGYNVLGGALWVLSLVLVGFFFGHLPMMKDHFSVMAIGILIISLLPFLIGFLRKIGKKKAPSTAP